MMTTPTPEPTTTTFDSSRDVGAAVQPCPLRSKPVHWIEIELVGEDNQPVPWVEYRVQLPDSTIAKGYLDRDGYARLDGLPTAGTCLVCFPELDEEAWILLETLAERGGSGAPAHA